MSREPAYERLPYEKHRKHKYYSQDHPLTAAQQRRVRRARQIQVVNRQDKAFGKINWAAYEHTQLYDMIMTADPAGMGSAAHSWAQLAYNVDSATSAVHKTVQKLLLSWRGGAAGGAAQSASKLTSWGSGASETMREVGDKLDHYTTAVTTARNKMPEPVFYSAENQFRDGYDVSAASGPSGAAMIDQLLDDHLPARQNANRAKTEAVRVMETYESASKGVHDQLPHFSDAPLSTRSGVDGPVRNPGGTRIDPGGNSTTAASAVDPGALGGMPGAGGAAGGMAGSFGSGAGLGGSAGSGLGGGASSGGAMPGGAGGAGLAGAAQSAAAGGRSGMGGGFMSPMGGGQRGQGDGEHENRYAKDGAFDFLEDLPDAYPPVLGE